MKNFFFISKRSFSQTVVSGRAKPKQTEKFLTLGKLPHFHMNESTGLNFNPIIHGYPNHFAPEKPQFYQMAAKRSLIKNQTNGVVVYHHVDGQEPYHVSNFSEILQVSGVKREEMIAIANLGVMPTHQEELLRRLSMASKLSGLKFIDIAFVQIQDETLEQHHHLVEPMYKFMSNLVETDIIQSFGVELTVEPFFYDTPTPMIFSEHLSAVWEVEEAAHRINGFDYVIYPIAPTHEFPCILPITSKVFFEKLTAQGVRFEAGAQDSMEKYIELESSRKFSRIALEPFECYPGFGIPPDDQLEFYQNQTAIDVFNEHMKEVRAISMVDNALGPKSKIHFSNELDRLIPDLQKSPLIEDKITRIIMSSQFDMLMPSPQTTYLMNKTNYNPNLKLKLEDALSIYGKFFIPYNSHVNESDPSVKLEFK